MMILVLHRIMSSYFQYHLDITDFFMKSQPHLDHRHLSMFSLMLFHTFRRAVDDMLYRICKKSRTRITWCCLATTSVWRRTINLVACRIGSLTCSHDAVRPARHDNTERIAANRISNPNSWQLVRAGCPRGPVEGGNCVRIVRISEVADTSNRSTELPVLVLAYRCRSRCLRRTESLLRLAHHLMQR